MVHFTEPVFEAARPVSSSLAGTTAPDQPGKATAVNTTIVGQANSFHEFSA